VLHEDIDLGHDFLDALQGGAADGALGDEPNHRSNLVQPGGEVLLFMVPLGACRDCENRCPAQSGLKEVPGCVERRRGICEGPGIGGAFLCLSAPEGTGWDQEQTVRLSRHYPVSFG